MKILSINAAMTQSTHNVALNVDVPPEPGVMERIEYGILQIAFDHGLLWVGLPEDNAEPISANTIANLQAKINEATADVRNEVVRAKEKHTDLIAYLAARTQLPVA
jgi:hypothetical protein